MWKYVKTKLNTHIHNKILIQQYKQQKCMWRLSIGSGDLAPDYQNKLC